MKQILLIVMLLLPISVEASNVSFTYRRALDQTPDSVRYVWWHGWDSLSSFVNTSPGDSLAFTVACQDTTSNIFDAIIYWKGMSYGGSDRIVMGNAYPATEDSIWYPLRTRWCYPPDSIIRRVWINYVYTASDPVQRKKLTGEAADIDSLHIKDNDVVLIDYTAWYGSVHSGHTEMFPTQPNRVSTDIIIDTIYDSVFTPPAPDSANLCRVYGVLRDARLSAQPYVQLIFSVDEPVASGCDSSTILMTQMSCRAGSDGAFSIDLLHTDCFRRLGSPFPDATGEVRWTVRVEGYDKEPYSFPIPSDSTTLRIQW